MASSIVMRGHDIEETLLANLCKLLVSSNNQVKNGATPKTLKYSFKSATLPSLDEVIPDGVVLGRELRPEPAELKLFELFESGSEPSRRSSSESPSHHRHDRRVCWLVVGSWKSKSWCGL
jgi:hypothetical protein